MHNILFLLIKSYSIRFKTVRNVCALQNALGGFLGGKKGNQERLQAVVSLHTKRALERLSRHLGRIQAATLGQIISEAQKTLLSGLNSEEQTHYYRDLRCNCSFGVWWLKQGRGRGDC